MIKEYKALDIAFHIINYGFKSGYDISNLHLQKLLYFVWRDFYKRTGKHLFKDYFYAWQFGPVVPSVYFEFCSFGFRRIYLTDEERKSDTVDNDTSSIIDPILDIYMVMDTYKLVELSHAANSAWRKAKDRSSGNKPLIPFPFIEAEAKEC